MARLTINIDLPDAHQTRMLAAFRQQFHNAWVTNPDFENRGKDPVDMTNAEIADEIRKFVRKTLIDAVLMQEQIAAQSAAVDAVTPINATLP